MHKFTSLFSTEPCSQLQSKAQKYKWGLIVLANDLDAKMLQIKACKQSKHHTAWLQ